MECMGLNDQSKGWWRDAACYQVYVRSFADSDGDGIGDLPGITSRLPYLADLGVDALWITPFYPSPQNDHGYDVADYCDVEPLFGQLADADNLLERAHALGLRVIVDLVPNHTSDQHRWFQEALAAGPGSPERARYMFRDSETDSPPNNWQSVFGGPAWTRTPDGQWYLHLFDSTQPDLDWRNPEVHAMFEEVLRFWLARGVDGFRIDVAHGLYKVEDLPNQQDPTVRRIEDMLESAYGDDEPMWDQPEIHDVYRRWAEILDEFGPDRMAVAEAWVPDSASLAAYVRPDELDQAFNFSWLLADWSAPAFAEVIRRTFASTEPVGASPTWVLSNHDVTRHPTQVRRWRARPRASPGRDPHHAGPARLRLPLPGRGAGPRGGRRRTRAPAGPGLVPNPRAGPRRLPGADPLVRRPAAVRLRAGRRPAVDPAARLLEVAHRRGPAGRPRPRPCRSTVPRSATGVAMRPRRVRSSRSSTPARTCSPSGAAP